MLKISLFSIAVAAALSAASAAAPLEGRRPGSLGIQFNAQAGQVVVGEVMAGRTAAEMGVKEGDVVLRLGDKPVGDASDLIAYAQSLKEGDKVALTVLREGHELELSGTAAPRPDDSQPQLIRPQED